MHAGAPAAPNAPASTSYFQDFASVPDGQTPPDWLNVAAAGLAAYPWLVPGSWAVGTMDDGRHMLEQRGTNWAWFDGAPPLSFMRFDSPCFGRAAHGLPDRYTVDVGLAVMSCDSRDPYYPIGDTGVQVYYLDPTHYCEMVWRPTTIDLWECNGGEPTRYAGWTLLHRFSNVARSHEWLNVHVKVDTIRHTLRASLPGGGEVEVLSSLLKPGKHWMTLRASDSDVWFDHVAIQTP